MLKIENLRPGEKLELEVRRHWIIFVMLWIYVLIALVISISFFTILWFTFSGIMSNIIFWMMFLVFFYIQWLNHELDLFLITNNRIIGVEQISFLNRTVSECNLWQVQEVNSKTSGLFANLLNYGTLSIQTAGNRTTLHMDYAPDSMQKARIILNIVDLYRDTNKEKLELKPTVQ